LADICNGGDYIQNGAKPKWKAGGKARKKRKISGNRSGARDQGASATGGVGCNRGPSGLIRRAPMDIRAMAHHSVSGRAEGRRVARKIIIDTDPGQDDAVAILLALAAGEALEVLGLTCVAGNVPLGLTARNARRICDLAGRRDVPVMAGCDRPMGRALVTAEHVHGEDGLRGVDLPAPNMPLDPRHAVDFVIETLREAAPGTVTLVALGPLTNLATAFRRAPDIVARVAEIVLMGGAHRALGNVTPVAEFNIHVDPQAADIVLCAGAHVTIVPLDVTHKALVTPARNAAFAALRTRVGQVVAALTTPTGRESARHGGLGAPLHDPCTIGWLLAPDLFAAREVNVMVETGSELTMGMTVMDWWGVTGRPANARVLHDIDADGFFDILTAGLARL
jgi:purine nucleosidase